jgi:hypothetical protein
MERAIAIGTSYYWLSQRDLFVQGRKAMHVKRLHVVSKPFSKKGGSGVHYAPS